MRYGIRKRKQRPNRKSRRLERFFPFIFWLADAAGKLFSMGKWDSIPLSKGAERNTGFIWSNLKESETRLDLSVMNKFE
jgi:hypothetical protein